MHEYWISGIKHLEYSGSTKSKCAHYNDAIMSGMASQITSLTIVYLTVHSRLRSKKYQSSASLAFVRGIHRWPVNSLHKGPVTRKMFPFDDVIMHGQIYAWWHVLTGLVTTTICIHPIPIEVNMYVSLYLDNHDYVIFVLQINLFPLTVLFHSFIIPNKYVWCKLYIHIKLISLPGRFGHGTASQSCLHIF